ncbi:hypothetical protein [Saccharothrix syringae]|uniref:Uncharacterized protein n=1 Tax=Saccharothrix syringae TaxID=103733 RepID=A0A5Q0H6P1_SACSY|nr:hypothetical protein [Saccharothrix syringae]QFZ21896.1 hypothetical protein EKG83_34845 [Saccharothrix syringae]
MSGNRTRGLLRAAALLAAGASPLLASAANAAEAPTDLVDGVGYSPEVGEQVVTPRTDLLSGHSLQLPAPAAASMPETKAPQVAAPAGVGLPELAAPGALPAVPAAPAAPQERALTPGLAAPEAPALPVPGLTDLPLQAPTLP